MCQPICAAALHLIAEGAKEAAPFDKPIILAPLRGVTGRAFRSAFARHYRGLDGAIAPFVATVAGEKVKPALLRDILPAAQQPLPLIPQVLGKSPAQLRVMLLAMREHGYDCCDLNAGCPWPFVVKKGRGAGLMRDSASLRAMLEVGCEIMPGRFSLKVRLGIDTNDLLLQQMETINSLPLAAVTIHARTARQMYGGEVDLTAFAHAMQACRHPVYYNGDIRSLRDLRRLRECLPAVAGWMVGRGIIADPSMLEQGDAAAQPRSLARLHAFVEEFTALSRAELSGPASLLGRLKELWSYLHLSFVQGEAIWKSIRTSRTLEEYQRYVAYVFHAAALRPEATDGLSTALFSRLPCAGQRD